MPGNTPHQFYDLAPLEPLLAAGELLLTPNARLARRIKSEWDALQIDRGLVSWRPAQVYALESWLLQCWQRAVDDGRVAPRVRIHGLQVRELWNRVIDADCREHGQYNLLHAESAAELAQQARDTLLRWRVDAGAAAVRGEFRLDPDCATFHRWLDAFDRQLESRGLATTADCLQALLDSDFDPAVGEATLVDFDEVPPLQMACLEQLAAGVGHYSGAAAQSAVSVRSYGDREAELAAAAQWASRRQRENPAATTAILLADMHADRLRIEYLLRREFDCLGERYDALPVNFSTGISLDRAPVIRDALRILATCGGDLAMPAVTGLFTSRFIPRREADREKAVRLLQRLFEEGSRRVSTARLRQGARSVTVGGEAGIAMGDAMREVQGMRLHRRRSPPSGWVEPFCAVLETWGWPGSEPLDSLEYQQVDHWHNCLETFAALDGVCAELDLPAALALLQRHCQAQVSQPQSQDSNVQVLGPLEGAGLNFDAIWLCGLQASRWPAPARPSPFIPVRLQSTLDMPHASAEREWRYAESLMRQYRGSCGEMVVSYARQADGIPELPSPLLAGMDVEHLDSAPGLSGPWQEQQRFGRLAFVRDDMARALDEDERDGIAGGAGILQDQANCPFRSFVRHRLRVEPLGDYYTGLSAPQRGTLLHHALYVLWGDIGDSERLQAMEANAAGAAVARAVTSAVDELPEWVRQNAGMACLDLEQRRLQALLEEWLAVERARPPFTVTAREQRLDLSLAGLPLCLRADRVDTLSGGATLVIDYKSGRPGISDWLGERPAQPQLPLYGVAAEVSGVAFAQVRSRECKLLGLAEVEGVPGVNNDIESAVKRGSQAADWQALRREWRTRLEDLAGAFIAGEAAVTPLAGACRHCGMESLCRVNSPLDEVTA